MMTTDIIFYTYDMHLIRSVNYMCVKFVICFPFVYIPRGLKTYRVDMRYIFFFHKTTIRLQYLRCTLYFSLSKLDRIFLKNIQNEYRLSVAVRTFYFFDANCIKLFRTERYHATVISTISIKTVHIQNLHEYIFINIQVYIIFKNYVELGQVIFQDFMNIVLQAPCFTLLYPTLNFTKIIKPYLLIILIMGHSLQKLSKIQFHSVNQVFVMLTIFYGDYFFIIIMRLLRQYSLD